MGATAWLQKMIDAPDIKEICPVEAILSAGKAAGFTKNELKAARKKLGITSVSINDVQYWVLKNA